MKPVAQSRKRKAAATPDASAKKPRATNVTAKPKSTSRPLNSARTHIPLPTEAGSYPDPEFMNHPTLADMANRGAQEAEAKEDDEGDEDYYERLNQLPSPAENDGKPEDEEDYAF